MDERMRPLPGARPYSRVRLGPMMMSTLCLP